HSRADAQRIEHAKKAAEPSADEPGQGKNHTRDRVVTKIPRPAAHRLQTRSLLERNCRMSFDIRMSKLWMASLAVVAAMVGGCGRTNVFQAPPNPEVTVAHPIEQSV